MSPILNQDVFKKFADMDKGEWVVTYPPHLDTRKRKTRKFRDLSTIEKRDYLLDNFQYHPDTGAIQPKRHCAGSVRAYNYIEIYIKDWKCAAHRAIWLMVYGYLPENPIDHINRDKHDNRLKNLREVSAQCNVRNRGIQCNNKSGVTGVCWSKQNKGWHATICSNGTIHQLGYYTVFTEAVLARWKAELRFNWPSCNSSSPAYLFLRKRNKIGAEIYNI